MIPALIWTVYPPLFRSIWHALGEPAIDLRLCMFFLLGYIMYTFTVRMGTWSDRM